MHVMNRKQPKCFSTCEQWTVVMCNFFESDKKKILSAETEGTNKPFRIILCTLIMFFTVIFVVVWVSLPSRKEGSKKVENYHGHGDVHPLSPPFSCYLRSGWPWEMHIMN